MQQERSEFWELMRVVAAYAAGLFVVLVVDYAANQAVSGRGMFGSIVVAALCAAWVGYRRRQKERRRLQDEKLKRRAIFYKNGERGSCDGAGLILLSCLIGLALLAATINFCAAAEPDEPALIDVALVEISRELWPSVPLSDRVLYELQYLSTRIGVLAKETENAAPNMPAATVEKRAAIRRTLKKLHTDLVDLQIIQAGEALRATRKAGAR